MKIRLNNLRGENVKGVKKFEMELDGENAVIVAENGVGKTTVYDAFLWLLFGKNSEGKTDFEVRPLDSAKQPIKGLVVVAEAELDVDGRVHIFRKEQHEKVVKGQLRGYETLCWIDEVPKKVGEYQTCIAELIPEDIFKLLTDLSYFTSKLHWSKRREVLLDIAGEIGTPKGFNELLSALNGRSIDQYKQVLAEQKKRYTKEREEINPRIDEIQKGLTEYAGTDTKGIEKARSGFRKDMAKLDEQRSQLFAQEKKRQEAIQLINILESKKIQREAELKSDVGNITNLLDEKAKLESAHAEAKSKAILIQAQLTGKLSEVEQHQRSLSSVRDEYNKAAEAKTDDTCYACGQKLSANKLKAIEQKRKEQLKQIIEKGNQLKEQVDKCKAEIEELTGKFREAGTTVKNAEIAKTNRTAEIDKQIASRETIPPESDKTWRIFDDQIKRTRKEIGEPVSEQLQQIDNKRAEFQNSISQLDKALAHADQIKQSKTRITELEAKEIDLAQKIADVEKQIAEIEEYAASESRLIEEAVNGRFKHVEFKLFDQLLNGGLEPCCEATYKGVPYADLSTGQQILVGIDIVNVLSGHYGVSVPMFIDHSESLTIPIETETQTIKLFAAENVKELKIEREGVQNV
jgi:DNA repair exonuclease SbcCD ATPase subunit